MRSSSSPASSSSVTGSSQPPTRARSPSKPHTTTLLHIVFQPGRSRPQRPDTGARTLGQSPSHNRHTDGGIIRVVALPRSNPSRVVWAWLCNSCGYDMDGLGADPHRCPECGAMSESFHALPRYTPTPRSLRALSWLVLLMAVGQVVNLAFYFVVTFAGVRISDDRMKLWAAVIGSFVTLSLLPGAVLIALTDALHKDVKRRSTSQQSRWTLAVLRLDLEAFVPAVLKRGNVLVAIVVIGLMVEYASIVFKIAEFEPQSITDDWIVWMLAHVLAIEGYVLATGAAGLLVQVVLERLPRRRHHILIGIGRPLFAHGMWVAAAFAIASIFCYLLTYYVSWFLMAAITVSSIVTCIFAHITLRRAIRHVA